MTKIDSSHFSDTKTSDKTQVYQDMRQNKTRKITARDETRHWENFRDWDTIEKEQNVSHTCPQTLTLVLPQSEEKWHKDVYLCEGNN